MDSVMLTNGVVSIVTAAALTVAILSKRVQEGVIIKTGLIILTLSMLASGVVSFTDQPQRGLVNAAFALRLGLLVVCLGVAVRAVPWRRGSRPQRRSSDYWTGR